MSYVTAHELWIMNIYIYMCIYLWGGNESQRNRIKIFVTWAQTDATLQFLWLVGASNLMDAPSRVLFYWVANSCAHKCIGMRACIGCISGSRVTWRFITVVVTTMSLKSCGCSFQCSIFVRLSAHAHINVSECAHGRWCVSRSMVTL